MAYYMEKATQTDFEGAVDTTIPPPGESVNQFDKDYQTDSSKCATESKWRNGMKMLQSWQCFHE